MKGSMTTPSTLSAALAPCRWCRSADCTPATSPHCYCLDCESPLAPCVCRPDCTGGNCYQPGCATPAALAEVQRLTEEVAKLRTEAIWLGDTFDGLHADRQRLTEENNSLAAQRDLALVALEEARKTVERLDESETRLIEERDFRESQINAIADALGDDGEWSNLHDRGVAALLIADSVAARLAASESRNATILDQLRIQQAVTEGRTVEAIAAWLDTQDDQDRCSDGAAIDIRAGAWKVVTP